MTVAELRQRIAHPPRWIWLVVAAIVAGVAGHHVAGLRDAAQAANADISKVVQRSLINRQRQVGLEAEVTEAEALLGELRARLVRESDRTGNVAYLYALAEQAGVGVTTLIQNAAPAPGPAKPAFRLLPFQIVVTGRYTDLVRFVHMLEEGRHFCRFATVHIQRQGEGGQLTAGFSLLADSTP